MIKVSVIIPIYGVESFIERCVRSLLGQTLKSEVEFIFINDATPDKSINILQSVIDQYPERYAQIKIIEHKKNLGLPTSRNTGLKVAAGEYIYHCDSDDFLEPDALEEMYQKAKEEDADIVWCDWYLSLERNERYMKQPEYETSLEALKSILSGVMKYNVWNKLIKRNLYIENAITFPDGYGMGEDMTMIRLFACANKVSYLPKAFYHYVKSNTSAFSQTYSERHLLELKHNVQETLRYLKSKFGDILSAEYEYFKLDVKYPFLISNDKDKYERWQTWYPEANSYILLNRNVSARRRALQWLAYKKLYSLLLLYYNLVYRFLYKIIFR